MEEEGGREGGREGEEEGGRGGKEGGRERRVGEEGERKEEEEGGGGGKREVKQVGVQQSHLSQIMVHTCADSSFWGWPGNRLFRTADLMGGAEKEGDEGSPPSSPPSIRGTSISSSSG